MVRSAAAKAVFWLAAAGGVAAVVPAEPQAARIERGRYLVEQVAMCGECHTPRDARGQLDRARWLQGAPVWFEPIHPVADWAYAAPPIAGLGSLTREQALQVLEKGVGPQGNPVRRPMNRYHMAPEEAEAIVAYLQSLK